MTSSTSAFWRPLDTDLMPSLQLVADRFPRKTLVTLGLEPMLGCEGKTPAPLDLPRGHVIRRRIPRSDFDRMIDARNFYDASTDLSTAVDPARWERISRRFG
jgi:hypothetical protein